MSTNNIYTNANENSFFPSFCKTKTSGYERLDQDVLEGLLFFFFLIED